MGWFNLSIVALITISISNFAFLAATKQGVSLNLLLLILSLGNGIYFGSRFFLSETESVSISGSMWLVIATVAICSLGSIMGNYSQFSAIKIAPNAGLVLAIGGLQSLIVAGGAWAIYRQAVTPLQGVALVLGLVAVILFNLGANSEIPQ